MVEERFGFDRRWSSPNNCTGGSAEDLPAAASQWSTKAYGSHLPPATSAGRSGVTLRDFKSAEARAAIWEKGGMLSGPPEPVSGVGKVGFSTMNDGVEQAAVRSLDVLGDDVGGVQVVVPEQHEAADQLTGCGPGWRAWSMSASRTCPCVRTFGRGPGPRSGSPAVASNRLRSLVGALGAIIGSN